MRKLLKKKVNIFGKTVPVFVIVLLGLGLVSAALVTSWGTITGFVTVSQGFQVGGVNWDGDQAQWSASLTSLEEETISSGDYSLTNNVEDVDAEIKFTTTCSVTETSDGCADVITTEMVELSVVGFETGDSEADGGFASPYYKKTDYVPVSTLDDVDNVTYQFKITENTFGRTDLAPYVVIVGDGIGSYNVAVYLIPDEETYQTNTEYTKTIDGNSLFHIPGDTDCANQNPVTATCTLDYIKDNFDADLSKIRLAIGAWPDASHPIISASMGISTINGVQAEHKSLVVGANDESNLRIVTDFPKMMKPDVYTFTTDVLPVTA